MKVKVRLFAELREKAGRSWLELEVEEGCKVREVVERLSSLLPEAFKGVVEPGGRLAQGYTVLVNARRAALDDEVPPNSVVAVLPPVGGGL